MEKSLITIKIILLILLAEYYSAQAQNNILNNPEIYDFLERFDAKGIITINHHQKPFERQQIYLILKEIEEQKKKLSNTQLNELEYFLSEYNPHNSSSPSDDISFVENNSNEAFRIFEYNDNKNRIVLYPDFGLSFAYRDEVKNQITYYNGLSGYGNIGRTFSFDFDFNDISLRTLGYNAQALFTPERGFDYPRYNQADKTLNYDRTRGAVTLGWDWGYFSLKKDYNFWGTGYNGNLILSDKSPSYPQIYLKLKPWHWLEFNYLYGELNSSVNDSSTFRDSGGLRTHIQLVEKYIAAHFLTIDLLKNIKLSIGESVIISDRFEPIYLVPVLFFRMADHYLSHSDNNSGNAQIFSSLSLRIPQYSTRLDFSLFIDEMSIAKSEGSNALGYSIGISNFDMILDNLAFQIEYVRIDPFVYGHADPVQSFTNRKYNMGHWIGSNADMVNITLKYNPFLKARTKASVSYIRKGDFDDVNQPRYQPEQKFLYGDLSSYVIFNLIFGYELYNNVFLEAAYINSNSWGKNNLIKVDDYKYSEFLLGAKIGFR